MREHQVIVSCLGQRSRSDAHLLERAAAAALAAMSASGATRYISVSQGLHFPSKNPLLHLLRVMLASHVADSAAMEQLVRRSCVEWTIVRPPRLLDGGRRRGYEIAVGVRPRGGASMQRADLAAFLVDEVEQAAHTGQIVGLTRGGVRHGMT